MPPLIEVLQRQSHLKYEEVLISPCYFFYIEYFPFWTESFQNYYNLKPQDIFVLQETKLLSHSILLQKKKDHQNIIQELGSATLMLEELLQHFLIMIQALHKISLDEQITPILLY